MMMNAHRNAMLGAARKSQDATQGTRIGIVSAYNPSTYCIKAKVQPSGVETGWLPIKTAWVGSGWGMQAGPTIGDQVTLSFQEGDANAAVVLGSLFNNVDQPMAVPSGELWIKHKSGSLLKFHNDGSIEIVAAAAINSSATAWNHTGPLNVSGGDVTVSGGDVKADAYSLKGHKHTGVTVGDGTSGAATP